jgi:uncharacterized lipoprotein
MSITDYIEQVTCYNASLEREDGGWRVVWAENSDEETLETVHDIMNERGYKLDKDLIWRKER